MKVVRELADKLSTSRELVAFFWRLKLWWLIPLVVMLLFFGIIIVVGSATGVGPFIYTLF